MRKIIILTFIFATLLNAANLDIKNSFKPIENIVVNFSNMSSKNQDWIGIYAEGANSNWDNVIAWKWTNDTANGKLTFNVLPVGSYEVRAFYNNSYHLEASKKFKVAGVEAKATLTTNKNSYAPNEKIIVNFSNMSNQHNDWIAIYTDGTNNNWANVVAWKWTDDTVNGKLTFDALSVGSYEVRAFYNNSYHLEASKKFKVEGDEGPDYILYADFENGGLDKWIQYSGKAAARITNGGAQGSTHSLRTPKSNGFYFDFGTPAKKLKFLELDTRVGIASHLGNFGVLVKTRKGNRRVIFSSYMNHPGNNFSGVPPEEWDKPYLSDDGYLHNHPGPTDYYLETKAGKFVHYKININKTLKILEPNNEVLSILLFTTAGGDFDNIALSAK